MLKLVSLWLVSMTASSVGAATNCSYSIDEKNSVIEATGYKFTEKKGVTGKILGVTLDKKSAPSIEDLLRNLKIKVDLMTLDSGNGIRDNNLREHFLAIVKDEAIANVHSKELKGKELLTTLKLNGVEKDLKFAVERKSAASEVTLIATSSIDALDFAMKPALAALAKRCGPLHKGGDGKSKTWSEFGLKVVVAIQKVCSSKSK